MSQALLQMLVMGGGAAGPTYVDDVFSTYLYTGNGSTQTINNGIDLAGKGGMVWIKSRTEGTSSKIVDTARGVNRYLESNGTGGAGSTEYPVDSYSSGGFNINAGAGWGVNTSTQNYVSWTFRKAAKFFDVQTVTKSAGSNATVSFADLATIGMVAVKRTDASGSWYVWHRSLTAGKLLYLEQTAAEATLGHITVSGTTVTLVNGTIADGSYVVYAWAHDSAADGIIQCGSYNATTPVTLGWEPQFIITRSSASSADGGWAMFDSMRGLTVGNDELLRANLGNASSTYTYINPTATGFVNNNASALDYIYLAIRRPNKPTTTGTQVYNAIARTGTGAAATVTGVGFAPDLVVLNSRSGTTGGRWEDRLRGATQELTLTASQGAPATVAQSVTSFDMDGIQIGTDGDWNTNAATYIAHFFRRCPKVFDEVCWSGDDVYGRNIPHNITVVPEMILVTGRTTTWGWFLYSAALGATKYVWLDQQDPPFTSSLAWNNTTPTSSVFTVGGHSYVNGVSNDYVAYLFATLAGVSKVGSYVGNGSSLTIDMGFTTGARFFMCRRTDAGNYGPTYVWDSARGIVAGNDPHISYGLTTAEVTNDDSVDPSSVGIVVNQVAATNINVNNVTYIYLAFA